MALTPGVDSYGSLDEIQGRLLDLGYTAFVDSTDQAAIESFARQACLHMELFVTWRGQKSDPAQALQWPRVGADADGIPFDGTPAVIVDAQSLLTAAAGDGPLAGLTGGQDRAIVAERSDDAAVTYERNSHLRDYPLVSAMIAPYTLRAGLGGFRQIDAMRG